jgi:hypothetical protein
MYLKIGDEVYTVGKRLLKMLNKEVGPISKNPIIKVVGDASKGERERVKIAAKEALGGKHAGDAFNKEFNKQYIRDVKDSIDEAVGAGFLETQLQKESIAGLTASKLVRKGSGKEEVAKEKLRKALRSGPRKMKRGGRVGRPKGVGAAQRGYGKAMK